MKTAIVIDSGCDVSEELIEKYDMKVLRLHVIYPEKDYADGIDIKPETIYERFPEEIPTTSTPSPQDVYDLLHTICEEGYTHVLAFSISSGLSTTYNTLCSALAEEKGLISYVMDTKSISFGAGVFAVWAAEQLAAGKSFENVVKELPRKVSDCKIFYYMDTLKYLQKGGRIGLVSSVVGTMLKIKPIISCNENGVYYTVTKVRGEKLGLQKLLETAKAFAGDDACYFAVLNGDGRDKADAVVEQVTQLDNGTLIEDKQITASMAVHTGPGLVGIMVFKL